SGLLRVLSLRAPLSFPTRRSSDLTRDRPRYLRRAVTSVLAQTYGGAIECIVVFDGGMTRLPEVEIPSRRSLRGVRNDRTPGLARSEEHTSELQSRFDLVCRLLLEK